MTLVVGVDLGGTRCKAGLVDTAAPVPHVVSRVEPVDVAGRTADAALDAAAEAVARLLAAAPEHGATPERVGIGLPGIHDGGLVVALPGKFPGMEGIDVGVRLRRATGLACHVANDAVAAGVGEATAGAGRGATTVVVVTIGTGVGTAVLVDGVPVGRGPLRGGIVGGQVPISAPEGPVDTAGNRGTIEARCRAERILAEARAAGAAATDVPGVLDAAAEGDVASLAGIGAWQRWFVRALVALGHAHGPDVLVVGGGPVRDGSPLLDGVEEAVRRAAWPGWEPRVVPAALGDDAGLVGAAVLALREAP